MNKPILDFTPNDNGFRPVLDADKIQTLAKPKLESITEKKKWNFSFRYFKQIDNFGLSTTDNVWFSGLLERFADLSSRVLSEFFNDIKIQQKAGYRFHPINWAQKNIPIQRKDIDWLPKVYREDDVNYPMMQFQISKATGRIVGFFDESWSFNIILLDPMHNIQPSSHYGYRVDYCAPLSCQYSALQYQLSEFNKVNCDSPSCGYALKIKECSPYMSLPANAIVHYIADDDAKYAQEIIDAGLASGFTDIFEAGLLTYNFK